MSQEKIIEELIIERDNPSGGSDEPVIIPVPPPTRKDYDQVREGYDRLPVPKAPSKPIRKTRGSHLRPTWD